MPSRAAHRPRAVLPDGKPIAVLCKQVEQATLDPDGSQGFAASLDNPAAARRSWTYNARGQVLTATDARNNTTTYTYHESTTADATIGDLQSVTNPAGHVTTFDPTTATAWCCKAPIPAAPSPRWPTMRASV